MRKLFLISISFFLITGNYLHAQSVKFDSTYRPDIYPLLRDLFQSEKQSRKDIIFLGNSITFWGMFNETLGNKRIKNRGIPGDHTFGVLDRLDDILRGKPAKIFLLIGINDIARSFPADVIERNYEIIVNRIITRLPGTKLFLQSVLPTNIKYKKLPNYYNKNEEIKNINLAIKRIAHSYNITFIDLYSHFADDQGLLIEELTFDGVHITRQGYDKWIKILKDKKYI